MPQAVVIVHHEELRLASHCTERKGKSAIRPSSTRRRTCEGPPKPIARPKIATPKIPAAAANIRAEIAVTNAGTGSRGRFLSSVRHATQTVHGDVQQAACDKE